MGRWSASAAACLLFVGLAQAGNEAILHSITERCSEALGPYGEDMVEMCVQQDLDALVALGDYPEQHQPLVADCREEMQRYGWSMIRTCVDQRLASAEE